jgi:UDP-glucose 4-epimerase
MLRQVQHDEVGAVDWIAGDLFHMSKPTVLVTGGAGYIGSHAVLALKDAGYGVVVIDNLVTGFDWAVPQDVTLVRGDIADQPLVEATLRDHDVKAIMHFAGSVVVPESVDNPLKYYHNNSAKTRDLIESAVKVGVPHFIFSSTAATYGIPDESPVRETTAQRPINPYGMSKLMTEYMLRDVAAAHPMNFCALRYFNVAGADPQGRTGQSTTGATHLIKVAVEAALGKRESVGVFGTDFDTPDGTGVRDYIHVSDLANAHVLALEGLMAKPDQNYLLNCGYGRGFSVLEVLDAVDRVTNRTINRKLEGRRAGDPDSLISDNSAILAEFPWQPRYADLEQIVTHALAWERKLSERG